MILNLENILEGVLPVVLCVFLRVGAMCSVLPAFGEQSIPARVKLAIALAFTVIVFPGLPLSGASFGGPKIVAAGMAEVVAGLFFGIMLRLFVIALQVAGAIGAQATSLSQLFGSAGTDPLPAMGHVLVIGGLALATSLDLHVQIAKFIIHSYNLVPIGAFIPGAQLIEAGVPEIARSFALGFSLAAPFFIASLIYNVTLGVINKAMPQLMVAFVGAPAITAAGLILLTLAAPFLLSIWVRHLMNFIQMPFGAPG